MMDDVNLPVLGLPEFNYRLRKNLEQRTEIFDEFRKRFVVLTPEEWVRQHMLHFMTNYLKYPAGLIGVEVNIGNSVRKQRADIVVYALNLNPWMIVECKAPDVQTGRETFMQAARYNAELNVPFLVVTNGVQLNALEIDTGDSSVKILKEMPVYSGK